MKIALMNIEPKIVNTALMQISQYHKEKGYQVEWYSALFHDSYDKIFCSSIFTFTKKPSWIYTDPRVSYGGTGFDNKIKLPKGIAKCNYDWSLYPKCDYSIIWFSRGCIRKCGFCVVPEKEGKIKPVIPKNLNPNGKHIKIMDNNFFANPKWISAIKQLQEWNQPCDFQGIDPRILTKEMCESLNSLRHFKQMKIAWDLPKQDLRSQLEKITKWIKPYKLMCYVLVGYNSTFQEDLMRVQFLHELGADPFVMKYNHRQDIDFLNHLARWSNRPVIRNSCTFEEYLLKKHYLDLPFDLMGCET